MKSTLRTLCASLLDYFESGDEDYVYKPSHRTILKVVGFLFLSLSAASLWFTLTMSQAGGILPFLVFFSAGAVCEIVGFLGSDRAVANIWRSR